MKVLNRFCITMINFYQVTISSVTPPSCRFTPTCSSYSKEAFRKFNFFRAVLLTIKRIFKCHPFHPGGYDPVP